MNVGMSKGQTRNNDENNCTKHTRLEWLISRLTLWGTLSFFVLVYECRVLYKYNFFPYRTFHTVVTFLLFLKVVFASALLCTIMCSFVASDIFAKGPAKNLLICCNPDGLTRNKTEAWVCICLLIMRAGWKTCTNLVKVGSPLSAC